MGIQVGAKPKYDYSSLAKLKISDDQLNKLNERTLSISEGAGKYEKNMKNAYSELTKAFKQVQSICQAAKDNKNLKTKNTKSDLNDAIRKAKKQSNGCTKRSDELTQKWDSSREVWYSLNND